MKYIRTKNDVYELYYNSEFEFYEVVSKGLWRVRGQIIISKIDIGKYETANSIEELCDEFVLLERNSKPRIFTILKGAINNKIYDDEEIYAAIWTSKGLIYVAKMDEKGKLELI